MQKNHHTERLRVGRDGDAWQREAPDVLDKQAPIFEPIQVVNPHTEMSVHFSEHAERVPRETWYRLILQECRKVTQADMRIRSIILDRHDTLHILFVMPDVPAMQELTIFVGKSVPKLQQHQMWTGYYASIREVLKVVRQYLSNQRYQSFSLGMYSFLRLNQQGVVTDIQMQHRHYYLGHAEIPIAEDEARLLQVLQRYELFQLSAEGLKITALGISALNYFARFYERTFSANWKTGIVDSDMSEQSVKPLQRKQVRLAREVEKND